MKSPTTFHPSEQLLDALPTMVCMLSMSSYSSCMNIFDILHFQWNKDTDIVEDTSNYFMDLPEFGNLTS